MIFQSLGGYSSPQIPDFLAYINFEPVLTLFLLVHSKVRCSMFPLVSLDFIIPCDFFLKILNEIYAEIIYRFFDSIGLLLSNFFS